MFLGSHSVASEVIGFAAKVFPPKRPGPSGWALGRDPQQAESLENKRFNNQNSSMLMMHEKVCKSIVYIILYNVYIYIIWSYHTHRYCHDDLLCLSVMHSGWWKHLTWQKQKKLSLPTTLQADITTSQRMFRSKISFRQATGGWSVAFHGVASWVNPRPSWVRL